MKSKRLLLLGCLLTSLLTTLPLRALTLNVVVDSEDTDVPDDTGAPTTAEFLAFQRPRINSNGEIVFIATLKPGIGGVTTDDDSGVYSDAFGTLVEIAREGAIAPGTISGTLSARFAHFKVPTSLTNIADTGQVAFMTKLSATNGSLADKESDTGYWRRYQSGIAEPLELVLREGDFAPSGGGAKFGDFRAAPSFNFDGEWSLTLRLQRLINGSTATSANDIGIWSEVGGIFSLVTRKGSAAPGYPPGEKIVTSLKLYNAISGTTVTFGAAIKPDSGPPFDIGPTSNQTIWQGNPGTPSSFAYDPQSGYFIADINDDTIGRMASFPSYFVSSNTNGAIAALVRMRDLVVPGASIGVITGVPTGDPLASEWQVIAHRNEVAPGGSALFRGFSQPVISDTDNRVAFRATLVSDGVNANSKSNMGIWAGDLVNGLELIARTAEWFDASIPDAPDETGAPLVPPNGVGAVKFAKLWTPVMNRGGQIAFIALLRSGPAGLSSSENQGIFATRTDGTLIKVARKGDTISLSRGGPPTDYTIVGLDLGTNDFQGAYSGGSDGKNSPFAFDGTEGKLAFTANLNDGSSLVIVADIP